MNSEGISILNEILEKPLLQTDLVIIKSQLTDILVILAKLQKS